jgi:hypothetical protein
MNLKLITFPTHQEVKFTSLPIKDIVEAERKDGQIHAI